MVPTPLNVVIVAVPLGLAGLLIAGIAYAAVSQRGSTPGIRPARVVGVCATILLGWVGLLFVLAARGTFAATPDTSNPAIALGIGIPIILGLWCLAASGRVRTLITAIPLYWLIAVQFYRVLGVLFLVTYLWQLMPAEFALHAGIGDILIGLTAPLVTYAVMKNLRSARVLARSWNVLGIAELMLAVTLGFLTSPSAFQQLALAMPNSAITRYPFVLFGDLRRSRLDSAPRSRTVALEVSGDHSCWRGQPASSVSHHRGVRDPLAGVQVTTDR